MIYDDIEDIYDIYDDIGMIIFHAHRRQGTGRHFLCYELLIDNYKYWYSNITGFSLTVLNYYVLIITNIVTMFFTQYYQIPFTKYFTTNVTTNTYYD